MGLEFMDLRTQALEWPTREDTELWSFLIYPSTQLKQSICKPRLLPLDTKIRSDDPLLSLCHLSSLML
jgi:hypothetical protein